MRLMRMGTYVLAATVFVACTRSEPATDTTLSGGAIAARDSGITPMPAGTPSESTAAGAAMGSLGTASSTRVGTYLTDATGRALYMFEKDRRNASTCSGECANAWPPFSASSTATSASGVASSKIGTITRSDNTTQSTYNGMPLYYYHDDTKAGDIEGQGKVEFGGSWYLVSPSGSKIEKGEKR